MATTTKSYIIPLRKSFGQSAPLKRTPRAVRAVKAYLVRHCKVEDVKLGAKLNELLWARGITNPPARVAVDVVVDGAIAKAELRGHAYKEAAKPKKKEEPQTLKEKIASKLGADQKSDEQAQEAAEEPVVEKKPARKTAPEKKDDS